MVCLWDYRDADRVRRMADYLSESLFQVSYFYFMISNPYLLERHESPLS